MRGSTALLVGVLVAGCGAQTKPPLAVTPIPSTSAPASASPIPTVSSAPPTPTPFTSPTETTSSSATPTPTAKLSPTPEPTFEEAFLLEYYFGAGTCSPKRGELPQDVSAAVECVVGDGLVDRVGLYAVTELARPGPEYDLYLERMAEYGIALQSGDCAAGIPGDSSWIPIDPPSAETGFRIGCFLNENDHANVRLTCPVPNPLDATPFWHLYIGVLGETADISALYEWTMGDEAWREYMAATQRDHPNGPVEEIAKPAICAPELFERN